MDYFYPMKIVDKSTGIETIEPQFHMDYTKYVMTQGKDIYAIWDENTGLWVTADSLSQNANTSVEQEFYRLTDEYVERAVAETYGPDCEIKVNKLRSSNHLWRKSAEFFRYSGNRFQLFDRKMVFANDVVEREDFVTRRVPYALGPGECRAWNEIVGTLYSPDERMKLEWAIGALVTNEAQNLQKFFALFGAPGTGKSTIFRIMEKLFPGYTIAFDAAALGNRQDSFSTEVFRNNPLVAIQDDGDLSKINDNTLLNSIVSHEPILLKQKYQTPIEVSLAALLFVATNSPIRITDANAGILRRLIDVHPTGKRIAPDRYLYLMDTQIDFELGAIAYHCAEVFNDLGRNVYDKYISTAMMSKTNAFYNFVFDNQDYLEDQEGITLTRAYDLYKLWCDEAGETYVLRRMQFREELSAYFDSYHDRYMVNGERQRSVFLGFKGLSLKSNDAEEVPVDTFEWLELKVMDPIYDQSVFDATYPDQPAQVAKESGFPGQKWVNVDCTLSQLVSTELHFVKVPEHHIVIDFDLTDEDGEKDLEVNLAAASEWPATYTETSKSGSGLHLHYIYAGDVTELASIYDVGIEVKTLLGDASLRRKLWKCNDLPIAHISGGLPKKEAKVIDKSQMTSEASVRRLIGSNLRKEVHPGTKSSIDFIAKILQDAYDSGMTYDVQDMRPDIMSFAAKSSNQSLVALKVVKDMKFQSEDTHVSVDLGNDDDAIVFFDVEVYPNLLLICWKKEGVDGVTTMINPTPAEVEVLFDMKLVGFNNRRYDNHILYARYMGFDNEAIYNVSKGIIDNNMDARFAAAYGMSYADIYDFSSKKQGLKKFQIELGITHMEMDLPWDQPCPEEHWPKVIEYCENDVVATEAVFNDRRQDFVARKILAEISGLSVNDSTQKHTAAIIFEGNKNPQAEFVYKDLADEFPGYEFHMYDGKSTYREEVTGEGGYVYAEPGVYENVALLDIASMHPTTIEQLDLFGPYTENFSMLKNARMAIKHRDYDKARAMIGGKLAPYLESEDDAEALSYALKIVINIVYGLTSARFENPFRDKRNVDNIVAKRGSLFMIDLKHEIQAQGYTVCHVKTDSVKIVNADEKIITFVNEYGKKYGYDFEHEATYKRLALVNEAVYIAYDGAKWTAVGSQFQHPYVYKTLFTKEPVLIEDLFEARNVTKGAQYLAFNGTEIVDEMVHIGKTGVYIPVKHDGGKLLRIDDAGKQHAVAGTKGYLWVLSDVARQRDEEYELFVDMDYYEALKTKASEAIGQYMDISVFTDV